VLVACKFMTHEGYNKPRNNLQSNQSPFSYGHKDFGLSPLSL